MSDNHTPAADRGSGCNDLLGQASEARWYCLDREGVAMLCKDEADARAEAAENDKCWPSRAPHRAVLLGDVAAERERCARLRAELQDFEADTECEDRCAEQAAEIERLREALEAVLAWGTDENYERARAACSRARIVLRTTGAGPSRPPTPVGWSDTDWLALLEQLQQNEAAYAKGPLPERGWD